MRIRKRKDGWPVAGKSDVTFNPESKLASVDAQSMRSMLREVIDAIYRTDHAYDPEKIVDGSEVDRIRDLLRKHGLTPGD